LHLPSPNIEDLNGMVPNNGSIAWALTRDGKYLALLRVRVLLFIY